MQKDNIPQSVRRSEAQVTADLAQGVARYHVSSVQGILRPDELARIKTQLALTYPAHLSEADVIEGVRMIADHLRTRVFRHKGDK